MDLTTATPAEIDTQLADLHQSLMRARHQCEHAWSMVRSRAHSYLGLDWRQEITREQTREALREAAESEEPKARVLNYALEEYQGASEAVDLIRLDTAPLEAEYERRGGWTRAFLVNNTNGHVHRSKDCSTTFVTTSWSWLPQLSGHDEAEIVEAAGSDACTVCYPSAPVEVLSRPRSVFSAQEQVERKSREQRAAEKAERLAKKIAKSLTPDGSELVVATGGYKERFKTEQAATSWAVGLLADVRTWRQRPLEQAELDGIATVVEAIATKHGETVEEVKARLETKIAAKIKRDAR